MRPASAVSVPAEKRRLSAYRKAAPCDTAHKQRSKLFCTTKTKERANCQRSCQQILIIICFTRALQTRRRWRDLPQRRILHPPGSVPALAPASWRNPSRPTDSTDKHCQPAIPEIRQSPPTLVGIAQHRTQSPQPTLLVAQTGMDTTRWIMPSIRSLTPSGA
jgi:hypothetical protein